MPARASREAGEIPAWTRRCDRGRRPHEATVSSLTGRRGRRVIRKPEDLSPSALTTLCVVNGAAAARAAASKTGGPGPTKCRPGRCRFRDRKAASCSQASCRRSSSARSGGCELAELPVPEPGPGEALIRVSVTGLCRTDLKIIRHGHRDLTLPRVPGEEVVGEVVSWGRRPGAGRAQPRRPIKSRSAIASTCTPACGAACAPVAGAAPRTSAARCASWAFTATAASPTTSRRRSRASSPCRTGSATKRRCSPSR